VSKGKDRSASEQEERDGRERGGRRGEAVKPLAENEATK
jgi:hypothetical protein